MTIGEQVLSNIFTLTNAPAAAKAAAGQIVNRLMKFRWVLLTLSLVGTVAAETNPSSVKARFGTVVLSVVSNEVILVAADSKAIGLTFGGEEKILSECKIVRISDNLFFATTGLKMTSRIHSTTVIKGAFQENTTASEGAMLAEIRFQRYLADELSSLRTNSPRQFNERFESLRNASVIIFGLEKESLFFHRSDFIAEAAPDRISVKVNREHCVGNACPKAHEASMVLYGHTSGLLEYHRTHQASEVDLDWIKNAMEHAIKTTPQFVGPPVDIIEIYKTGPKWLQVKDACK